MKLSEIRPAPEKERTSPNNRTHLIKGSDPSPYSIYLSLRALFGEPNGHFDETRSQWCYKLIARSAILEIYDWRIWTWSLGVYEESGDVDRATQIGQKFVDLVTKQSVRHNSHVKRAVSRSDSFVIQNPFSLYYHSALNLLTVINEVVATTSDASANHLEQIEKVPDLCRSGFFLFVASIEGFLNLIYELYLRPELRDDRIADRLSREHIDIRIRLAPVYCSCFKRAVIDVNSEVFKEFQSVVILRNDFIHANLTRAMKTSVVREDDHIFLVPPTSRNKHGMPTNMDELGASDLANIAASIEKMIALIVQEMKPRDRSEFLSIMERNYVWIDMEEGDAIVVGGDDYLW